jgi:hypothetical protein
MNGALLLAVVLMSAVACEKPAQTTFTKGGSDTPAASGRTYRFNFDDTAPGLAPADFINVLGDWAVTSEHALRQQGRYGSGDFPRLVLKDLTFQDFTLSVKCRPESGGTDQACGVMFRLEDSDNYFVTRANALEGNVRLYRVVDGDRQQFASGDASVTSNAWHTLGVAARGTSLTVRWDGVDVFTATDATFTRGKIGLWTKADSVTSFDELEVTAE